MTFIIPDKWEAEIKKWQAEHECKFRVPGFGRDTGFCGGSDEFTFIPTTVATFLTVKCACGAEIRINDF